MVIDHHLYNGNIVAACRCKFIHVHTETSVSRNVDAQLIRLSKLGPDTGPQAIAHGSQAAGGKKSAWLRVAVILRRPHLMLSHIRGYQRLSMRHFVNGFHDIRTGQTGIVVFQRVFRFQFGNLLHPFAVFLLCKPFIQILQYPFQIPHKTHISPDIFIDFRRICIHMDNIGIFRKFFGISDHTVRKPGAKGNQQVTAAYSQIGCFGPVHANHTGITLTPAIKSTFPHQRIAYRRIDQLRKFRHFLISF